MEWLEQAKCKGAPTDLFFPKTGMNFKCYKETLDNYCGQCPVVDPCLEYAIEENLPGIFGGTSAKQRRAIKSRRLVEIRAKKKYNALHDQLGTRAV